MISALIFTVLTTYIGVVYREVTRLQLAAAGARAQLAADQLANLLAQNNPQRLREARRIAELPGLETCIPDAAGAACRAVIAELESSTSTTARVIQLWTGTGRRLASVTTPPSTELRVGGTPPSRDRVGVGRLHRHENLLFTETVVELPGHSEQPIGFVVVHRPMAGSAARELLNQLIGNGAVIKVGNQDGDIWTDLASEVRPPAVDLTQRGVATYHDPSGVAYIGALRPVDGTPLAAWVEFRQDVALADSRNLLRRMVLLGVMFLVAASGSAWFLSGRLTTPLRKLTEQAEAIAGGDYTRKVATRRRDEIGRLTLASNEMADRIREDHELLERRVAQRTEALAAANQELESFSYSVSHDLRAPLRHVSGFANLLGESAASRLDDTDRRHLNTITEAAARMGQLIDDLLDFSRTGRAPLAKQPVALSTLVEEVRRDVMSGVNGRSIHWTIDPLPDVQADPAMLRVVLTNLLSNAAKYTSKTADARIDIGTIGGSADAVTLFVRDNGVGFDMQYAHKLFGVFQRLHHADEFEGTGIGLANVRRIVARHGGRVWAEARVNAGATFYVTLPASSDESEHA